MKPRPQRLIAGALVLLALLAWGGERAWMMLRLEKLRTQEYEPPPAGMVFVPAGEFLMGSDDPSAEPDERPLRKVFVPAFYIDQFEVTNRRYKEFKTGHCYPPGADDLPATFVFKREAEEFCRWAGRRLPTGAEWEKAARGNDGRTYPWGNDLKGNVANVDRRTIVASNSTLCKLPLAAPGSPGKLPGGSFPQSSSPYGCQDMAGNVWEWVSDVWLDKGFLGLNSDGEGRGVIRGGAYGYSSRQARASYQGFEALEATCHDVGFRCAVEAIPRKK